MASGCFQRLSVTVEAGCYLDLRIRESSNTPPALDALPFKVDEDRGAMDPEDLRELAYCRSSHVPVGKVEYLFL